MAVSYGEVQQAFNNKSAAESALQAAEAEEAQIVNDGAARASGAYDAAKSKTQAARGALSRATATYNQISAAYTKENPNKPAQTASQTATANTEAEKDKNQRETGIRETDVQRATRERAEAPKQARPDSPVQQATAATGAQNANTNAARQAETVRDNTQDHQLAVIKAQEEALYHSGLLYKDIRNQVSQEAIARQKAQQDGIDAVSTVARSLIDTDVKERQQNIDYTKARATFIGDTLNTAMPKVVELMLKTPKGSKVAANFLRAYLVMANEVYKSAGLDKDIPPFDRNTPQFKAAMQIVGYKLPDQIPQMPTADQISWQASKAAAVGGFPPNGWQGGLGVDAFNVPDMPAGTNGAGVNVLEQADKSPEGQAIKKEIGQRLQGIPTDPAQQTPEQRATVAAATAEYQARLKDLSTKQATAPRPDAIATEQQSLRQQLRSALVSGDPDQKLRIMAAARTALENQAAGLPLTDDQTAVLSNLDKEDLDIIKQQMTPELAQILVKPKEQRTDADYAAVQAAVTNTTTAIKARPTNATPPGQPPRGETQPPVGQAPTAAQDPNVLRAEQQAHEARQRERDAIKATNPELDAEMSQIEQEQQASDPQAAERDLNSLRQQAEERLRQKKEAERAQAAPSADGMPRLSGPSFDDGSGGFGIPGSLGNGPYRPEQPEEPSIPEIPKLFGGFDVQQDQQDVAPSIPELPTLFQPHPQPDEEDTLSRPRSLFNTSYDWR